MFYNNYANYNTGNRLIKVNGEAGAMAYQIPPDSAAMLLDINQPIVYLVQTDGAGYKTVTPYRIEKCEPEPKPNYNNILERLKRIEDIINEQSHTSGGDRKTEPARPIHTADEQQSAI